MTDKELIQQAFNALDKMTDLFPDARGGHGQEAEDACNAALVVMADLAARLQQPQKTNQCAETCERANLCDGCGGSLTQEQGAIAWWRYNAQGEPVLVGSSVKPYEDAVPLFTSEPQKPCQPIVHWRSLQFNGGRPISETRKFKQKPWVGLTDEEVSQLIGNEIGFNSCCGWEDKYTRAVEAKIKELNT